MQLILVFCLRDVFQIYREIEKFYNFTGNSAAFSRFFEMILEILLVCHFVSILWYNLAIYELKSDPLKETWLGDQQNVDSLSHFEKYTFSFYWFVVTMSTLGYGDIYPKTHIERLFVIICTFISCGVFGLTMNTIGNILEEISQNNEQFKGKMANLNSYMDKHCMSKLLQNKVRKYFEYLHSEKKDQDDQGRLMINSLASNLKQEVLQDLYSKFLYNSKIFQQNFSYKFLNQLAVNMQEETIGPEEIIYKNGDYSQNVYFIIKGKDKLFSIIPNFDAMQLWDNYLTYGNYNVILEKLKKKQVKNLKQINNVKQKYARRHKESLGLQQTCQSRTSQLYV
ncbi:Cyclic nucleotide-binding protein [Pseudocohnilembus persalinus]|uniref:Cyclic nucleotide-binding protein n=1 Tax=Pseudocohnilembus persalinus TaxID=266149 RepID=A0A0V0QHY1_PSEPJ|nr:Cyclic nucleotide-binding protein [Pseudocohnilembus persalinus]|eukprot:KRX01739.1 Cyclic nucleotide-binding protein [Pseudocohnilembus persalinus]